MGVLRTLSLNCQKGYNPTLGDFLKTTAQSATYDLVLLQEATENVIRSAHDAGPYRLVEAFNEEAGGASHLAILYRDGLVLKEHALCSVAKLNPAWYRHHPGFGALAGVFEIGGETVIAASVHLHSGFRWIARGREIVLVKAHLERIMSRERPDLTLFGGDCNFGPTERAKAERLLAPGFTCVTQSLGPTLDSRYTESGPLVMSVTAQALAKVGMGFTFATDHFFVDSANALTRDIRTTILPDRVSDHLPIALEISA